VSAELKGFILMQGGERAHRSGKAEDVPSDSRKGHQLLRGTLTSWGFEKEEGPPVNTDCGVGKLQKVRGRGGLRSPN